MDINYYFLGLFDYLSSFAEFDSVYVIGSVVLPLLISILAAFVYDIIKKRDTRAAEDYVIYSLCEFVKRGKTPNGNLIERLINEAAKKYSLEVCDLPAPDVFVDRLHVNLLKDSLYDDKEKKEVLSLLEYIKNRCRRSCKYTLWLIIKKWVEFFVFITLVTVLVFVLFIVFGFIYFYAIDFFHILLLLTLIGFLFYFCITCYFSNPIKKKCCLDEIESSWKRFKKNWTPWKYVPVIGVLLIFVLFIVLGLIHYESKDYFHLILILTLIGFLVLFCFTCCFSNPIVEELLHDEIVKAWKRYVEKGNEEADNEHWQLASDFYKKALESYPASEIEECDYGELFILQGKALANLGEERFYEALDLLKKGHEHVRNGNACQVKRCVELGRKIELEGEAYCYMACIYAKLESKECFKTVLADIKKLDNCIRESVFNELESWLQKNLRNPEEYIELVKQIKSQENNK